VVWWFWALLVLWLAALLGHVHVPEERLPQRWAFPIDRLIVSARSSQGRITYTISTRRAAAVVSIPLLCLLCSAIGIKWFLAALVASLILLACGNLDEFRKARLWFLEDLHVPLVPCCLLVVLIERLSGLGPR